MNQFERCRKNAELNQVDVAEAMDVTQSTVSMWESGSSKPRADKLPALAALYNCTVDDLLREEPRESA